MRSRIAPIDEGQILTQAIPGRPGPNPPLPGPLPPPGMMVDSVSGSPFGVAPGGLGIFPGIFGGVELDALSYGRDSLKQQTNNLVSKLFFSVDEFASGDVVLGPFPAENVFTEDAVSAAEASADVFAYLGPVVPTPPTPAGAGPGNVDVIDGDGLAPFGGPGLGLIEPNPPTFGGTDPGDNLDAVDVDTTTHDVFGLIYFSLDAGFPDLLEALPVNTGTAVGNGFVGADVLVSAAGLLPALYAPAGALGLNLVGGHDSDDLGALAMLENGDGVFTPGVDPILFSVRHGSAVIGFPDSLYGLPIEEGDVLTLPTAAGALPSIFIPAEALGLGTLRSGSIGAFPFGDELDALDVVPEPSSFLLAGLGMLTWLGCLRRRATTV